MKIERKRIDELTPAPYNPRVDIQPGDDEYDKLKRSLQEFGYVEPVIWNERTGYVVGGHQRLKVLRQLGETEIDCVIVDLPEAQEKALNIALNKISNDWDEEKLGELLYDLQNEDIDLTVTGFDSKELDKIMQSVMDDDDDEEIDTGSYGAKHRDRTYNKYHMYDFYMERAAGYYQFPIVKACHYMPEELIGFDTLRKVGPDMKTEGLGVHFFTDDYQFESMWTRTERQIERLSRYSCVLMPDFSTYWDMPMSMKIWNVYRMHLVSQLMQDAGLCVMPIIRGLGDETHSWCFDGIEPGGVVAYSTTGIADASQTYKDYTHRELKAAIEKLKPEQILLYGQDMGFDFQGVPVKQIKFRRWENAHKFDRRDHGCYSEEW